MTIRRITPDVRTRDSGKSRAFYATLGLAEVMDLGWAVIMASPSNPTAQVVLITEDASAPVVPDMSIELPDGAAVDSAYESMRAAGAEIVHPLQDEPWGVRRFFVRDPDGKVVNVVTHHK
ncbi:VOC family protein [Streptomyces sp. TRM66268-LWL]|uniref:VOC family protein n=1 Tax=Streptomyces polyasparticus TaxID=2767826 RepID=A0ABR7SRF5_9ACTN|nr:VOC family protein [Streptomyces polyasparticus]MBC9718086.1 VOC family protein [Streptomyces polyasparticus]